MTDHPFKDFAEQAARMKPGETIPYFVGPSLARAADLDPKTRRIRDGFLCLGTPEGQFIRPMNMQAGEGSAAQPPKGLGLGHLTQKAIRNGSTKTYSYRFTRAGRAEPAEDAAPAAGVHPVRGADGELRKAG